MSQALRSDARQRRARIERVAVDLVLEHGFEQLTVAEICRLAGVSERTFFNHFATKEAAVLGPVGPEIDERAAREFIPSRGSILLEATRLVRLDAETVSPELMRDRMRAITSSPTLLASQIARLDLIAAEVQHIVLQRLRAQYPSDAVADLELQANVMTHLLAGMMRFLGERQLAGETSPAALELAVSSAFDRLRVPVEG